MIRAIFFDLDGVLTTDKTGTITTSKFFEKKLSIPYDEIIKKRVHTETVEELAEQYEKICHEHNVKFN